MARFPSRVETDREPDLTIEDFIRTTALAPEPLTPAYWAIAILGLRIGEFCALTRLNLRPKTHTVQIPGTKTRGSSRVLPVDPRLWSWIERPYPAPSRIGMSETSGGKPGRRRASAQSGCMIFVTRWHSGARTPGLIYP